MSLNYDEKVKDLLSEGVYEVLLTAVDEGKIDQKKAESIAEQLHKSVVGDFRRQVSSDSFDRTDFREILSGWYQYSAFDFTHEEAVKCLIRALKHPNLGEDLLSSKLYQNDSNFFSAGACNPIAKEIEDMEKQKDKKVVLFIGETGVGKSTLCNAITCSQEFKVSSGTESCTQEVRVKEGFFRGDEAKPITIIDTVGFNDGLKESDDSETTALIRK